MKKLGILIFAFAFSINQGKLDQAFEALSIFDYFKAKSLFEKLLDKQTCAASYGLSKVYYEERNHFFNLDSAEKFINQSILHYAVLDEKSREKLLRWKIDSLELARHKNALAHKLYSKYLNKNSAEDLQDFIVRFSDYDSLTNVIRNRNLAAFNEAIASSTLFDLKKFMDQYPDAEQFSEAKALYDKIQFEQNTALGTEQELSKFIDEHPESPYIKAAEDALFDLYLQKDSLIEYFEFIDKYPLNSNVKNAYSNAIELGLYKFKDKSLLDLRNTFPAIAENEKYKEYLNYFRKLARQEYLKEGELLTYNEGFNAFLDNGKTGFTNFSGDTIVAAIYDDALGFKQGLCVVEKFGKYGLIDRRSKIILETSYEEIGEYSSDLIMAYDGDSYKYFNNRGEEVFEIDMQPAGDFMGDYLLVKDGGSFGMINKQKDFIFEPDFEWLEYPDANGECRFKLNQNYGLINLNHDTILDPVWNYISSRVNEFRILEIESSYRYFGKDSISDAYDQFNRKEAYFLDGYAVIHKDGKFGVIDTSFNIILPIKYNLIGNIGKGSFKIKDRNKVRFFNVKNKKPGNRFYDDLALANDSLIRISNGDYNALMDFNEELVFEQDSIKISSLGKFFLIKGTNDKYGLINSRGDDLTNIAFDEIIHLRQFEYRLVQNSISTIVDFSKIKLEDGP